MDKKTVRVTFRDAGGHDLTAQVQGRDLGDLMEALVELVEGMGWSLLSLSVGEPEPAEGGEGST